MAKRKKRLGLVVERVACDYGCGGLAYYRFVNGKVCCCEHPNGCLEFKRKVGKITSERNRNSDPWNKGLTKEMDIRLVKIARKIAIARYKMARRKKLKRPWLSQLCECGCGGFTKYGRFLWGHWMRSKEGNIHIKNQNILRAKREDTLSEREKEILRKRRSKIQKESYRGNPDRAKNHSKIMKGRKPWQTGFTKETHSGVAKMAESRKGKVSWSKGLTKENHAGLMSTSKKLKGRESWCKGLTKDDHPGLRSTSDKVKALWQDSDYRRKRIESHPTKGKTKETSEIVARHAEKMKGRTRSDEEIKKILISVNARPNKLEKAFFDLLQHLFPNQYKYVGNGEVSLGGAKPDYININGKKKIIEIFGDYWHSEKITGMIEKEHEQKRINHFRQYGYDCLVIWENEFKNENNEDIFISKLIAFHKGELNLN